MTTKILAFAGSLRKGSYNKQILNIALEGAKTAGGEVTHIALNDYPLPLYDADLEQDHFPDEAKTLKELFWSHDALLIATPEYNTGIPAVLKNTLDWVSRPLTPDEPMLACYKGKLVAILSASVSPIGGLRAMMQLRTMLQNMQCLVIPQTHQAGSANNGLGDESRIAKVGEALVHALKKMS